MPKIPYHDELLIKLWTFKCRTINQYIGNKLNVYWTHDGSNEMKELQHYLLKKKYLNPIDNVPVMGL